MCLVKGVELTFTNEYALQFSENIKKIIDKAEHVVYNESCVM